MICTEQERAALMAHVRRYGHARDRDAHEREMGDYEASERWNKSAREYLDAIRAMLAPDDAVVRGEAWSQVRRLLSRFEDGSTESMAIMDGVASKAVDLVCAVLRGEATR